MELTQNELVANLRKMHSSKKYYIKEWSLYCNSIEEIEQMIDICSKNNLPTNEAKELVKQLKEVK